MKTAYDNARLAFELMKKGGKLFKFEELLINALQVRYMWPLVSDFGPHLNRSFAMAMNVAWQELPDNADMIALFVESLMNLRPWKLWKRSVEKKDSFGLFNEPDPSDIQSLLERALKANPHHPGICHMYIHLMEMSNDPGRAIQLGACSSLRLAQSFPDSGHLLHMPSHIDVQVGKYKLAVDANLAAVKADEKGCELIENFTGSGYSGYILHNYHMLVFAAMMGGMEKQALDASGPDGIMKHIEPKKMRAVPPAALANWQEPFAAVRLHALIRFGKWKEILLEPEPADPELFCTVVATRHYARGIAYAVLGKDKEAEMEVKAFIDSCNVPLIKQRRLHNNTVSDVLKINGAMLQGEVMYQKGIREMVQNSSSSLSVVEKGFQSLRDAVFLCDNLNYDEPWGQMQPPRHALGALLLEFCEFGYDASGEKLLEAISVFKRDLAKGQNPGNPWSLAGLCRALGLQLQRISDESVKVAMRKEIEKVRMEWKEAKLCADVSIRKGCACALRNKEDVK
eukprot:g3777.t1